MAEQAGATNHNTTTVDQADVTWDDSQGAASKLMSQEGVFQLTQDLRKFSETLISLKGVFSEEKESLDQSLRVAAHERLGELLKVLKNIVNKYEELNSTGILNAAENLINHIKNFNYESSEESVPPEIFSAINNLALAFSSSVSECLIGDINISPRQSSIASQSYENIQSAQQGIQRQSSTTFDTVPEIAPVNSSIVTDGPLATSETVADVLEHVVEDLDVCFERAKAWSKYAYDLMNYVKKKSHIEMEYAKQLTKLSQATRTILSEQSYLPFQSLYCTALDNDKEYASKVTAMYQSQILAHKFVEALQSRRTEHDRTHKGLREAWRKDKRRLEEAEVNLKKAKQQYQTRNQEYQKAKEAAIRADQQQYAATGAGDIAHVKQGSNPSLTQLSHNVAAGTALGIVPSSKMEKKKKQEDDSYLKAMQAEQYYRACVNEANTRRKELEKKEIEYLRKLRELLTQCDQTTKSVTLNFFQLHCELASPTRVQYQALLDESKNYEPGFQYAEYLKHLTPHHPAGRNDYQFEPYALEGAQYMEHGGQATLHDEPSPITGRASHIGRSSAGRRTSHRGFSDTESSSSRSLDDISPSASPGDPTTRKDKRRPSTEGSLSSEDMLDEKETSDQRLSATTNFENKITSWSPDSSPAPLRSQIQMPKMMKIVKEAFKGMKRNPKATVFGVDFSIAATDSQDGIPVLIKRCVAEIDNRWLTVKGIYRVNGVKNRVEKLCTLLDSPNCARADLSEQMPHDVSGVLKFFLRQLPEPLLLHRLYNEFLEVAKEYTEVVKESKIAESAPQTGDDADFDDERVQSLPEQEQEDRTVRLFATLDKMRDVIEKLPDANRNTLQFIVAHLSRIAGFHNSNKMTASNLAIIFGPTLLRPVHEAGKELQSLLDLPSQSHAIEMLITHRNRIFDTYAQKARIEENKDQVKNQSSVEIDEFQLEDNHEAADNISPSPQDSKSLPPPSHMSTVSSSSSGDLLANDQVHLTLDGHSTSATSSSGDMSAIAPEDSAQSGQKDSFSGDSAIGQSNGSMNMIDGGRTIISHSSGITKRSSPNGVSGEGLRDFLNGRNTIRVDISDTPSTANEPHPVPGNTTSHQSRPSTLPSGRRSGLGATSDDQGHTITKGHTSPSSLSPPETGQSRARSPGQGTELNESGEFIPIAPVRSKSKRRSSDKNKAPDIPEIHKATAKPVSPHRPRSTNITGIISRPHPEKHDISSSSLNEIDTRRASVAAFPSTDPVPQARQKRSSIASLIHPTAYKSRDDSKTKTSLTTGRRLPQLPTTKTKSSASPTRSHPTNIPGRTPPFNKNQTWSFAKTDIANVNASKQDGKNLGVQKKIFLTDEEEEEISFC
ncbi:rho GTPase-activating protein 45-like isoform X2 [Styela clava]